MSDTLFRTVQVDGLEKPIQLGKELREEITRLNKAILVLEKGSPPYRKVVQSLAELKSKQAEARVETRKFQNILTASGKTGADSYRKLSASLSVHRNKLRSLLVDKARGIKLDAQQKIEVNRLTAAISEQDRVLKRVDAQLGLHHRNVGNYTSVVGKAGRVLAGVFGVGGVLALSQQVLRSTATTVLDFDKKLIAVGKTTDTTGPSLKKLGKDIIDVAGGISGISIQKLLETSEVAGQLGIRGSANILNFSETIEKLRATTNISTEETVRNFAKFIQVSDETADTADRLGAAIVDLGNNFPTTEAEIIKNTTEIQKGIAVYNTSASTLLGLGAATRSLGLEAEITRGSFQKAFDVLDKGISTGKNLDQILEIIGGTQDDLSKAFEKDASEVFVRFIGGLSEIKKEGGNLRQVLTDLQLAEKRTFATLGSLAVNFDTTTDAVRRANAEYRNNEALNREFEQAQKSLAVALGDTKDAWDQMILSVDSGNGVISRTLRGFLGGLNEVFDGVSKFNETGNLDDLFGLKSDFGDSANSALGGILDQIRLISRGGFPEAKRSADDLTDSIDKGKDSLEDFKKVLGDIAKEIDPDEAFKSVLGDIAKATSGDSGEGDNEIRTVAVIREELKSLRSDLEQTVPKSKENIRVLGDLKRTQKELDDALGKKSVLKTKTDAEKDSLEELRLKIVALREEINFKQLSEPDLIKKLKELSQLQNEFDLKSRRNNRIAGVLGGQVGDEVSVDPSTGEIDFKTPESIASLSNPVDVLSNIGIQSEVEQHKSLLQAKKDLDKKFEDESENDRFNRLQSINEKELEAEEKLLEKRQQLKDAVVTGLEAGFEAVSEIRKQNIETEKQQALDAVNEEYQERISRAGNNVALQEQLAAELEVRKEEITKEANKRKKKQALLDAGIETALAIIRAAPNPFLMAAAAATGAAQTLVIASTKAERGARIEGNGNSSDGRLVGPSHAQGGIDLLIHKTRINAEGGEEMQTDEFGALNIINKKNSSRFSDRLKRMRGKRFFGKAAELSAINMSGGHGKRLARIGERISASTIPTTRSAIGSGAGPIMEGIIQGFAQIGPDLIRGVQSGAQTGSMQGSRAGSSIGVASGLATDRFNILADNNLNEESIV